MARLSYNKSIILAALLVFGMWACEGTSRTLNEENKIQRHEQWMARYGRAYKDDLEKQTRFKIFKNNVAYIEAFNNAGNRAYKLSVNEFADQTNEEFKATRNGFKLPSTPRSGQTTPFRYEEFKATRKDPKPISRVLYVFWRLEVHRFSPACYLQCHNSKAVNICFSAGLARHHTLCMLSPVPQLQRNKLARAYSRSCCFMYFNLIYLFF
ncbi:putative fruit bromelain [Helianthus debilis subsp. tardiflorus]